MSQPCAQQAVETFRGIVEPREEGFHFLIESISWRCFVVHPLAADRAGHDLHGIFAAKFANADFVQAGSARREQRRLPGIQLLQLKRFVEVARGIEQYFDESFYRSGSRWQTGRGKAQATGERTSQRIGIELLAFDGARGDAFLRQDFELCLKIGVGIEKLCHARHFALGSTRGGEGSAQGPGIPCEVGPLRVFPDPLFEAFGCHIRLTL